jgi:hypothetical protein
MWAYMWNAPAPQPADAADAAEPPLLLALYVDRYAAAPQFAPRELTITASHDVFAVRAAVAKLLLPEAEEEDTLTLVARQLGGGSLVLWYRSDQANGPEHGVLLAYDEQSGCWTAPPLDGPFELEWPPQRVSKRQRRSKKAI